MAFTARKENKNIQPGVDSGLEASSGIEKETIDFLEPKKNVIKDSLSDPYRVEVLQKNAYQYTLKTLNALKIVSPIITALMQRPGIDASNEELSKNFKELITETSAISESVCTQLGIDPLKEKNFWIRNVLEKSFAEIINAQWTKNGKINIEPMKELIEHVIKFGETTSEKTQYDEIPEESLIKLATIKAMLPILNEAQNYSLYRNLDNDIEDIMTKLFNIAKDAVIRMSDDYASEKDRSKLFYMIIQEAGVLYATSWKAEGLRIENIMSNYEPEKLAKTLEKYKNSGGLPIKKVDDDFNKYFEKILVITEKLVHTQKGNIEKRLKKN